MQKYFLVEVLVQIISVNVIYAFIRWIFIIDISFVTLKLFLFFSKIKRQKKRQELCKKYPYYD